MSDRTPTVRFLTFGCKVNQAESDALAADARAAGLAVVADESADVVVVNSCTVTAEADRKVRKAVRHALGLPGHPTVVVTGCLAALEPAALSELGGRVLVAPEKGDVVREVLRAASGTGLGGRREALSRHERSGASHTSRVHASVGELPAAAGARTRVQVKVQDGCDAGCAYCIVPAARGLPRSVPVSEVVRAVERLVDEGVAEVVLTGINVGRYSDGAVGLAGLIARVAQTGVRRIRLSSVEPADLDDALLEVCSSTPSFCEHLHVPLQSGSDRVLRAMGRPYDTRAFLAAVEAVRSALPGCALTTDVIAGFPGETDRDARATLEFAEQVGFARLHVFRFSARQRTRAATLADQVPPAEKAERASALRALSDRLAESFARDHLGSTVELLVEQRLGPDLCEGTTREYLKVELEDACARPGEVLPVCVLAVGPGGVARARR